MTKETESVIIKGLDTFMSKVVESVHTGLCEEMGGPNAPEFYNRFSEEIDKAHELILKQVEGD